MVLAVLEKRTGLEVSKNDVYVSTVGGVRLVEPAADLAIAIAVSGAMKNRSTPPQSAAVGELSLAGEIRPVTQAEQRRSEAARLGYRHLVDHRSKSLGGALSDLQLRHQPRADDRPDF